MNITIISSHYERITAINHETFSPRRSGAEPVGLLSDPHPYQSVMKLSIHPE